MLNKIHSQLFFILLLLKIAPIYAENIEIEKINVPFARNDYSIVTIDNLVFFAGGRVGDAVVDTVDVYDLDKDRWSKTSLSEPRYSPTIITSEDNIFFVGGYIAPDKYSKIVDVYDKRYKKWVSFELSQARNLITAFIMNNKAFFVGGRSGMQNSNVVDIYDIDKGELEQTSLSQPRYSLIPARVNDNMVLFAGGNLNEGIFSDVIDIYNLVSRQWMSFHLSKASNQFSIIPFANKLVITLKKENVSQARELVDILKISEDTIPNENLVSQSVIDNFLSNMQDENIQEIMGNAPIMEMINRIRKQIKILEEESLEESILKLDEVDSYYWPGAIHKMLSPVFPLEKDAGQRDIDMIMSNRRFLKVFEELSNIEKEEATALLKKEINKSLKDYQSLYEQYLSENNDYFESVKSGKIPDSGPIFQINNNEDGTPTFKGMRLKVLALVFLAGNLKLEGTSEAVNKVIADAIDQKKHLYENPFNNTIISCDFLVNAGLYNRQILITGFSGTSLNSANETQLLKNINSKKEEKVLTSFNADTTEYDLLSEKRGGPVPVDYSKGTINIEYIKPIEDTDFELFLKNSTFFD